MAVFTQDHTQCRILFSTEGGKDTGSKWRTNKYENYSFYMSLYPNQWRAVPVFDEDLATKVRQNAHENIPYSWRRYLTSVWPLRSLAW